MKYQLESILTDLGLSENEARVYLAALSLGPSTILKIAQAAQIKRTTAYSVVEALKLQGLMLTEVRGFKRRFVAEDPVRLETMLERRRTLLQEALPGFSALYNLKGGESLIKYYEGLAAVKSVYEGLIRDVRMHEDYLIVSNMDEWISLDYDFFMNFTQRRAKLPIKIRLLVQDSKIAREHKRMEHQLNETIKFLPPGTLLNTNLVVIPRRVVIHQLHPPIMAIVIENPTIARMHKELFEIIWKAMKE